MNIEVVFHKLGVNDIIITDKRIKIGDRTFSRPHITFVEMHTQRIEPPSELFLLLLIAVGLGYFSFTSDNTFGLIIDLKQKIELSIGAFLCTVSFFSFIELDLFIQ